MFLYPPCCVHRDRRPDQTVSGAHSPRFVLFIFESLILFLCLSVPRQGSRRSSSCLSPRQVLRDPVWAPDYSSCPEEASASKPAQEGFWFLWAVLSCLSGPRGPFLSCHVLFCVSSPGGLPIPPNFPREFFFGGVKGFRQ